MPEMWSTEEDMVLVVQWSCEEEGVESVECWRLPSELTPSCETILHFISLFPNETLGSLSPCGVPCVWTVVIYRRRIVGGDPRGRTTRDRIKLFIIIVMRDF